jgi:hypothetical protein
MSPDVTDQIQKRPPPKPGATIQTLRDIHYASKVIILSLVGWTLVWIFAFGQPKYLWLGMVQLFNCGPSAVVEDPWTCDREPHSASGDVNE